LADALECLKSAQSELIRSERMASVATLVKGIAHELNNPINVVAGNMAPLARYSAFLVRVATQLASGRPHSAEELQRLTQLAERKDLAFVARDLTRLTSDIDDGARRALLIIRDLQSLTWAVERGLEEVDLERVVHGTVAALQSRVPARVQINTYVERVTGLRTRAGQLDQVLINLLDNALRAVSEVGTTVAIDVRAEAGQMVLSVTDDGVGMTADVRAQALEPFFSTRGAGEGSGLGLAIVASIVRGHAGALTLESEVGAGTRVEIRLGLEAEVT
jgi:two-component system NtrC family sensor kinase